MVRLDHLSIKVRDYKRSRDWYRKHLGLKLEFEIPERGTAALLDDADLTLFVGEVTEEISASDCVLTFQVDDVEAKHHELSAAGVKFVHPPQKVFWGYGAELKDPDGYVLRLWDQVSMREKGGG